MPRGAGAFGDSAPEIETEKYNRTDIELFIMEERRILKQLNRNVKVQVIVEALLQIKILTHKGQKLLRHLWSNQRILDP